MVGDWLAEPMRNRVSNDGGGIQVEPKVMGVLMCLARHAGRTVTKDTFFEEVWEDTVVSEDVLSRCISELRRVLQDDARQPRFIETIRKTGYRLIAKVGRYNPEEEEVADAPSRAPTETATAVTTPRPLPSSGGRAITRLAIGLVVFGSISLASIIIYQTFSERSPVQHFAGPLETVPYTSYRGLELDPALSPSGDQVAFAWDDELSADFDIYLKQTGAESPLRLTDSEASERFPSWAPDGLHLAFVRSTEMSDAVFTIPSIGGKERKLVDFGPRRILGISWAPEGDMMAVSAQAEVGGAAALYLVRTDSTGFTQLTDPPITHLGDIDPNFSPDGQWLAFVRSLSTDVQDVYVMSMQSRDVRAVTADSVTVTGLDWTPDGRSIVFASFRGFMSSLWKASLQGGEPEWIVTASLGNELEHPSLARLSDRLTYVRRSRNMNVWKLTGLQNGRPEANPVVFTTGWDSYPELSPAGGRLAFVSDQTGRPELWVSDIQGRNLVQLTDREGRPLTSSWSPDGSTLAFTLRRTGQADIYLIDSEGGNPRQVTRSAAEDLYPHWSGDGRSVVFSSDRTGRWELWRSHLDGSATEPVTSTGAIFGIPDHSGRFVYLVKPGRKGIWRLPMDVPSAEEELIVEDLAIEDLANWSLTGNGIYYIRRDKLNAKIAFHAFDTNQTTDIYDPQVIPRRPAFTASANGRVISYTQVDEDAGDIQMVDSFE